MRRVIAALVVVGLAVAVVMLWPDSTAEEPPDTLAGAPTTTSTSTSLATTTTAPETTSTSAGDESHVVETVEEAEEILRELWFGWFEGIYDQDEERIREVVGNPDQVENAVAQFGVMEFNERPRPDLLAFSETEILRSTEDCLAIWSDVDARAIVGETNDGVHVFLWSESDWVFVSQWAFREDLWEDDCRSQLP